MRSVCIATALIVCAGGVSAQEAEGKYRNEQLGVAFDGVYGWEARFVQGSGAWSELANYGFKDYGAEVTLLVRSNPYAVSDELRASLVSEFKEGGELVPGKTIYKEIAISPVEMTKGNRLPGFQVDGFAETLTKDGKKRERIVRVATFFGQNRLFRVHCSAFKSRAKRVTGHFQIAISSLVVTGKDEKVLRGVPLFSRRGKYSCRVPEGFSAVVPAGGSADMRFANTRLGITVSVVSYVFQGDHEDHLATLEDHWGEDFKTGEKGQMDGREGFAGSLSKDGRTTFITGTVANGRAYRVHTSVQSADRLDQAKRIHSDVLESFKLGE